MAQELKRVEKAVRFEVGRIVNLKVRGGRKGGAPRYPAPRANSHSVPTVHARAPVRARCGRGDGA